LEKEKLENAKMKGMFELETPRDLLEKLKYDFKVLQKDSNNSYAAFNFYVTAEHMKDWIFPGRKNGKIRSAFEKSHLILKIVSHIANGAKHFEAEDPRHISVVDTIKFGSRFPQNNVPSGKRPPKRYPKDVLRIALTGDAEKQFGSKISAVSFAKLVLQFWAGRPEVGT
jgi:hypothetical protein